MTANPFFVSAAAPVAGGHAIDPAQLKRVAAMADEGGLDFLVLEQPGDAIIAASWLIPATRRIGLVSSLSATYAQPFHVARSLSATDILSGGRMGWVPLVARHREEAPNFGNLLALELSSTLDKVTELVAATEALWDSWDHDALVVDKESGCYLDNSKIRRIDYRGAYFQVMGALNAARPLQGHPVLVLDDSDPLFERLHDRADILLIAATNPADAEKRIAALQRRNGQRVLIKIAYDGPIADTVENWRDSGIGDGCHLLSGLANLQQSLSELRRRSLLTDDSAAATLRARLGLPVPVNPYSAGDTNGKA